MTDWEFVVFCWQDEPVVGRRKAVNKRRNLPEERRVTIEAPFLLPLIFYFFLYKLIIIFL